MPRVVFHEIDDDDAAELYRLRAEQLSKREGRSSRAGTLEADGFEHAITWATRSALTKRFLMELESNPGEVVWVQEYCRQQGVREEQLRGALGSFWRNARRFGFDLHANPVIPWEMDPAERVGYRVDEHQAATIRRILA